MDVKRQVEFAVTVKKTELVAPEIALTQEHRLQLTNLDMLVPPLSPGCIFCYKKPLDHTFTFQRMVEVVKESLSKTLTTFYPLSGEMVQNEAGEPEVLCNNRGVYFTEAFADVELKDLNFYLPDQSFGGKLVPVKTRGLLEVQVTELKCGGVVVAFTVNHQFTDGQSTHMFLLSWIEASKGNPLPYSPSFGPQQLLSPRHHGHFDSSVTQFYAPLSALPPPTTDSKLEAISRLYYIRADEINHLQSLANDEMNNQEKKRTKLEAFSAFLWKTLASSAVDKSNEKICRLGIVIDGRFKLAGGEEENAAKTIGSHYGNVLSIPFEEKKCQELNEKPLTWVASQVHEFLENAVTKEHFLGLVEWVETRRPEIPGIAKIYTTSVRDEGPAVVVSSGQRFPVAKIDFGWGAPAFPSYYFPWGGQTGYVTPLPSPKGNGDWIVYMHMLEEQLDYIESCDAAANFFKPLTSTYLNII